MACSWDPDEKYKLARETGSLLTDIEQTLNQLMRQTAKGRDLPARKSGGYGNCSRHLKINTLNFGLF
jgi:hypothetical protein